MQLGCCVGAAELQHVVSSGFDFAELQVAETIPRAPETQWHEIRDRILSTRVPILGFNVLLPSGVKVVGPDVDPALLQNYVETAFARMSELGGRYLSFGSGAARTVPDGFDRDHASEQLEHFISFLADLGKKHGITVNIEFLNRSETNMIVSLLEAQQYLSKTNTKNVKLLADLYHMMEEKESLDTLYLVARDLGYVHVADSNRLFPGSGSYPYEDFAAILHEIDYRGPVSVECRWHDKPSEMALAAEFLRRVFG